MQATLLDEVLSELGPQLPLSERILRALRVPPACHELEAVAVACEPALTRLCDYHDNAELVDARDVIRGLLRLLSKNSYLSRSDYRSIDAVPAGIDDAYRSLPRRSTHEPWWRETLREALIARMLLSPDQSSVEILADALRAELPIDLALPKPQNAPSVRLSLLQTCLKAHGHAHARLILALADTNQHLGKLPALRTETVHPENAAAIEALLEARTTPAPGARPRERLARIVRDIGVSGTAQRREYHAPPMQRLPLPEGLHELVRRAYRWDEHEQVALHATLLLGRIATQVLRSDNSDPHCHVEQRQHEAWIHRQLPDSPDFTRVLGGFGYENVGRVLHLPLPRRTGHALAHLANSGQGPSALRSLEKKFRDFSRDTAQPMTLRRITRVVEHELENEAPDEALAVLVGLQARAERDAGIHYFSPATTIVVEHARSTIEHIAATLDLDALDEGWSVPPTDPTPYFGYSYRADIGTIRRLTNSLRSSAHLERGRTNSQRILEAYNARVALLMLMFLAGTGVRPTGTVLPTHGDTSSHDRAAFASEKDALGYRSSRLVPLPTRFIAEWSRFDAWARTKRLVPLNPSPETPLAMLRTPDGTYVNATITACKQHIAAFKDSWPWPDDMLRHLFRSRLWELGCPSSWLRRIMGHHPPHDATDMPWNSRPQWDSLNDWTDAIDAHLEDLGL